MARLFGLIWILLAVGGCERGGNVDPVAEDEPRAEFEVKATFTLEFDPEKGREINEADKDSTVKSLQARMDGVLENVRVRREGADRVLVEIGDSEVDAGVEKLMTQAARLSFQMAHPNYTRYEGVTDPDDAEVPNAILLPYRRADDETGEKRYMLVSEKVEIRGDQVTDAKASASTYNEQWIISLTLNEKGGNRMHELSKEYKDGNWSLALPFAIILDGEILFAPRFNEPIAGGRAEISGNLTEDEARRLASSMQTPLAVPLKVLFKNGEPAAVEGR